MQKKIQKRFLVSEIIASEKPAVNCPILREYLSRQVNALRNSFKTLHISNRDFIQRNCLHNDQ